VGGGTRCDTLAVGFGATKNNIGIATLKLGLNNESLSFNCLDDHITSASTKRFFESDTTSIQSQTWTGIDGESHIINIRTDSLTGEFSAMLPPLKYVVQSVRVDKNPNIEFNSLSEIDLTNPKMEMADSLRQRTANNDSIWVKYKYNTKKVFTYYSDPKVKVVEIVNEGGAFGEETVTLTDSVGNNMTTPELWSVESDGKVNYLMEHPVYKMGASYEYDIFGYEEYVNYDSGTPVSEIIPLNGQEITSMGGLQKQLQYYKAGTEVTLTVQRQDGNGTYAETTVKVTLGTRESIQGQQNGQGQQSGQGQQNGQGQQSAPGGQNGQNGYNN
jgi:hypothetical protein